jgi:hypothetical protein
MNTIKTKMLLSLCAGLMTCQAQATEFSLLSGSATSNAFGNSYAVMQDGLTVTATAWASTGHADSFETAKLKVYPGFGLGICNRSEIRCPTRFGQHGVDNRGADDLVLFTFSSAVQLDALQLLQIGRDSDLSLWAGTGSLNLQGLTFADLGAASLIGNTSRYPTFRTYALDGLLGGEYTWLAVAPRVGDNNDLFKLRSLSLSSLPIVTTPVPEPQSWAMWLAGLGLLSYTLRRRT